MILSGYRSALYDDALANWTRVDFMTTCMTGEKRTECVWLNYDLAQTADEQLPLW